MDREDCLQCGTTLVGGDCAACDNAGRTEALVMAGVLALIGLGLGLVVWFRFI